MVAVGEDLGLQREERAARVHEVEAGQAVLARDLLCPQVLLHGEGVVRAALDGRVVRDDHALPPLDHADPRDDPGRRRVTVVELPGGQRIQLQERVPGSTSRSTRSRAVSLPARAVPLDGLLAAAGRDQCRALAQLRDERLHARAAPLEGLVTTDFGREHCHGG